MYFIYLYWLIYDVESFYNTFVIYISGGLGNEQIEMFLEWSGNIDANHAKFLTFEGQDEMILLAERMQKRFPNIIPEKYDNDTFLVSMDILSNTN